MFSIISLTSHFFVYKICLKTKKETSSQRNTPAFFEFGGLPPEYEKKGEAQAYFTGFKQ